MNITEHKKQKIQKKHRNYMKTRVKRNVHNANSAPLKNSGLNLFKRKTTTIIKRFAGYSNNVSSLQNERHLVVRVGKAINFPSPPCVYHEHTDCLSSIPATWKRVGQNVIPSIHG
jgi:hypothetical protein